MKSLAGLVLLAVAGCSKPQPVFHSCHRVATADPARLERWLADFAAHHKLQRSAAGNYEGGRSGLRLIVELAPGATQLTLHAPPGSCDSCHEKPHDLTATLAQSFETANCTSN